LGKTATAIVAADRCGARSLLVVAPTVVAHNWQREIARWSPHRVVQVITNGRQEIDPWADTVVTTHGLLLRPSVFQQLVDRRWDATVLDEAHAMRNPRAKRTAHFYGLQKSVGLGVLGASARVWALTGTPMPNHPAELWSMLYALAPDRIALANSTVPMNWFQFRARFCVLAPSGFTPDGVKIVGAKNAEELRSRLAGFALRRKKKDHLALPPIRWGVVALTVSKLPEELLALERSVGGGTPEEVIAKLEDTEQFSAWRRLCGLAKVEAAAEMLAGELEGTQHKLVVFAHHVAVVDALVKRFRPFGVLRLTGEVPAAARQAVVRAFQEDRAARVIVCNILAGGVGITLHASNDVVFVESSFVPGEMAQAADRCHRIGQEHPVAVRVLALAGSIDELCAEILARKAAMIAQVLP
jgi:SNF2 family DNA or RNA helicase